MKSLYVHIPFCDKKCFYCSFVVAIGQLNRADEYVHALKKEAECYKGARIKSIYFGGGTPTTLDAGQFGDLAGFMKKNFRLAGDLEFTVEANPEGLDAEKLGVLRALGVNRVSLGIQTFQDDYLKYLGRIHDKKKAIDSFHLIREAGFKNVSCDLMISFPGQTGEQILQDLRHMVDLSPEHISLYTLTIEPNSRFFAKKVLPLAEELQADHYQRVVEFVKGHGYERYEVSNFSKPGYQSVHNVNYWECGDYIGLGIGAHSHIEGRRFYNVDKLPDYLAMARVNGFKPASLERLDRQQRLIEAVLFGLRMDRGVNILHLQERYQCILDPGRQGMIEDFIQEGLLRIDAGFLKASGRGVLVLDELCSRLY